MIQKKIKMGLTLAFMLWLGTGCRGAVAGSPQAAQNSPEASTSPVAVPPVAVPPVAVTKIVSDEPIPSPTPFTCTPLPVGMSLELYPLAATLLEARLLGFQPNETVTIVFTAVSPGHKKLIEDRGILIDANGQHVLQEMLGQIPGSAENHWKVAVLHARGVACAEITLPTN